MNDCNRRYKLKDRLRNRGITEAEFVAMVENQKGLCAICGRSGKKLVIDHCHKTGKVRGLLCYSCNLAIGLLNDSPELFSACSRYVVAHKIHNTSA